MIATKILIFITEVSCYIIRTFWRKNTALACLTASQIRINKHVRVFKIENMDKIHEFVME